MADGTPVVANEARESGENTISSGEDDSPSNGDTDTPAVETKVVGPDRKFPQATLSVDKENVGPQVDLWDTDWPTGRYYWTVVPVGVFVKTTLTTTLAATSAGGATVITIAAADQLAVGDVLLVGTGPA